MLPLLDLFLPSLLFLPFDHLQNALEIFGFVKHLVYRSTISLYLFLQDVLVPVSSYRLAPSFLKLHDSEPKHGQYRVVLHHEFKILECAQNMASHKQITSAKMKIFNMVGFLNDIPTKD